MIKFDLRDQGCSVEERFANKPLVTLLWIGFMILIIAFTLTLMFALIGWFGPSYVRDSGSDINRSPIEFELNPGAIPLYLIEFIFFMFLYFGIRHLLTMFFCTDRVNSVKLKILENKGLPICHCREGLKVGQTVLIYIAPVIIVYISMFIISITMVEMIFETVEAGFLTMLLFMTFFMAFDLTLIVYVLTIKIRDKIDYIALDNHIYKMTLYKITYVRNKKAIKKRMEAIREKRKTRVFTSMTTCVNPECDNYGQRLQEGKGSCPSCGRSKYKAEVFSSIITCINPECENYGEELKTDIERCSICGSRIANLALKFNPDMTKPAIISAAIAVIIFGFIRWYLADRGIYRGPLVMIINIAQIGIMGTNIILGYISKNKWALMITAAVFVFFNFMLEYFLL